MYSRLNKIQQYNDLFYTDFTGIKYRVLSHFMENNMEEFKKFNHEGHKKLWQWLADNPDKEKIDYFIEHKVPEDEIPKHECYACDSRGGSILEPCSTCPLNWSASGTNHCDLDGYFAEWKYARGNPYFRRKYAKIIKDLPLAEWYKKALKEHEAKEVEREKVLHIGGTLDGQVVSVPKSSRDSGIYAVQHYSGSLYIGNNPNSSNLGLDVPYVSVDLTDELFDDILIKNKLYKLVPVKD
jgi:hypothetical protein